MKKKNIRKWGFRLTVGAVLLAVAAMVAHNVFYGAAIDEEQSIFITSDTSYPALCNQIEDAMGKSGVKCAAFRVYAERLNLDERFKVGHYRLPKGASVVRIVRMLAIGEQSPVRLVVGEARTLPQLAGKIARQIEADSCALLRTMYDREVRRSLGYVRDSLIAMFVPNTYEVYWSISPKQLLDRMKREYDAFWNANRTEKLAHTGLSRYEAITLASIVYEETKNREEMPRIAGVYINRLRKGMPLQACPTVKYAMQRFDLKRVLHTHLKYRSPYNTYINRGLPPAPICVPSIAAIDAVLNYERSEYLYFCARPEFDGRHNFARTLREHNANSRKYSEQLRRKNIK